MAAGSISTCVPDGKPLKKFTTPPRRTMASACCHVAGFPAASTTESGPRRSSVKDLTAATTSGVSVTLIVAIAPSRASHIQRRRSAREGYHPHAAARKHAHKFRPIGPQPIDRGGIARAHFHFVNAAEHAGKRLNQRRAAVIDGVRHFQHVFHRDAAGDAHVFGISAVVEEQIFAKIFLPAAAVIAAQTRSGVGGDHAHANPPARVHTLAHRGDVADDFVAKHRGRLNHFGVIAALPDFQVGAIGKRETNAEENFFGGERRHVNHLDAQIFAAIQARPQSSSKAPRPALTANFTSSPTSVFFVVVVLMRG